MALEITKNKNDENLSTRVLRISINTVFELFDKAFLLHSEWQGFEKLLVSCGEESTLQTVETSFSAQENEYLRFNIDNEASVCLEIR